MKVSEIMTTDVAAAAPDTTLQEVATMMKNEDTGAIPVVDDEVLVGIITDRDIVIRCLAEGKDPAEIVAEEIISEDLETIEPDDDVREAARLMASKQVRRLPVVEDGRLIGMVSLGDIAVKHSDDQESGETLESVSQGVKQNRGGRASSAAKPARAAKPAEEPAVRGRERAPLRQKQERGESRRVTGGTRAPQGISNHEVKQERGRQRKVVPIRNQGKTTRKRKAS